MSSALKLHVDQDPAGGWLIALGAPDAQPASGHLSADMVEQITAAAAAVTEPPKTAIRTRVDRRQRLEEEAGRALARVLSPPQVHSRYVEHRTLAATRGETLILTLECPRPEIAALPWELLAIEPDGPPLEERMGTVARLMFGDPVASPKGASRLRLILWCPTPDDPICREVLEATAGWADVAQVVLATSLDAVLPQPDGDTSDLVMVVCHGEHISEGTILHLGVGVSGPGTIVRWTPSSGPRSPNSKEW